MATAKKKTTKKTEEKGTQLIDVSALDPKVVFKTKKSVIDLIESTKAMAKPTMDASTDEGREELRSLAYKITRTKTGVDTMGKEYIAELKKVTTAVDEKRKLWRDTMEDYAAEVRKPLTDFENEEKERIAKHQENMQFMRDAMHFDYEPDSGAVEERIAQVKATGEKDFQEFKEQAATVLDNTVGRLGEKLAHLIEQESKDAEIEALRAKAAELDKIKADQAKEAAPPAETPAAAPAQQETPAPQPTPVPESRGHAASCSTAAPPAESLEIKRKKFVNNEVLQALFDECMLSEGDAKAVITAIASDKIPHTTINY